MISKLNGQLKKPKAVFFDWDGTLVDSLAFLTNAHNQVRRSLGIEPDLSKDDFHHYLGMPRDIIFSELYDDLAKVGEVAFVEYYNDNHLKEIHLIDGAADLLETLSEQGITLGLVSNKRGNFLRQEVKHLGWEKYFQNRIIGSGDTDEDKPSALPLNTCMAFLDENFEENDVWYVGDTDIDLACAKNANVIGILYNPKEINVSGVLDTKNEQNLYFSIKKYKEICGFLLQCL